MESFLKKIEQTPLAFLEAKNNYPLAGLRTDKSGISFQDREKQEVSTEAYIDVFTAFLKGYT